MRDDGPNASNDSSSVIEEDTLAVNAVDGVLDNDTAGVITGQPVVP
ncbi:hypothetical protein [Oceanimonas baumannii]